MRDSRRSALQISFAAFSAIAFGLHAAAQATAAQQVALDAPEVLQRSPLDCGLAALSAVLRGFGVQVEYSKLTDLVPVDSSEGASIDTVEEVANRLGVEAQQVMLPLDHLFLPGTHRGPMIAVEKRGALKHFLVLWRTSGEEVQLMDPGTGRRAWVHQSDIRKRLYVHEMTIPAKAWKAWSHEEDFHRCLLERMRRLGMSPAAKEQLWAEASRDSSVRGLQALDAAVRLAAARPKRTEMSSEVRRVFECSRNSFCSGRERAPAEFWSAWEAGKDTKGEAQVTIRGVVLLLFYPAVQGRH